MSTGMDSHILIWKMLNPGNYLFKYSRSLSPLSEDDHGIVKLCPCVLHVDVLLSVHNVHIFVTVLWICLIHNG